MGEEDEAWRVRFYGAHDMATGWFVPRVGELAQEFDPKNVSASIEDILELHNVQQYLEHGFLPIGYSEEERSQAQSRISEIRGAVARFFSAIDNTNFAAMMAGVSRCYHRDLLDLLGRYKAFERCDSATVLPALIAAGVQMGEWLASKKFVQAYDAEVRGELLASPRGAEQVIRKYLQAGVRGEIHLPASFTPADARELLEAYVDSESANPNYVGLIATAKENREAGIDAKLKLRAKRRSEEMTAKLFAENHGLKTGCEVRISGSQKEPVVFELDTSDGLISRYTYSRRWFEETCDNPSILNNFQHLFEFVDRQGLLTLPSYPAHLGVVERIIGTTGKTEYKVSGVFRAHDMSTRLQTSMYHFFLESKGIDLEQVVSWFFEKYLVEEFGAANFSFTPSDKASSYLQRVRHLFAEMESVATQFSLFVKDGELDRDLLAMGSEQVRYRDVPSLLGGKYVYVSEGEETASILNLLFSDQSGLNYVNESLNADNGARLLLENQVAYDDFEDYQKPSLDRLIKLGVVEDNGTHIQIVSTEQLLILRALFTTQAASYYHLSAAGRAEADAMVAKGWAKRRSSLLTEAEGKYFNYFLNNVDSSNGPQLRNKYLHGSQANGDGHDAHFNTYITALRLTVALVIKMNDDFCLSAHESSSRDNS
ncbi:hypothetical protein [Sinomonas humi]|uniref:Uncharacterized protein n=1 Tax=Sinomonas humi TaxID=1338436 RepID=A0A0B2AFB7_9MICC|nr:hypothetical protein [Sinomonas humi]KHL01905.1 hypothetical protein LK10_14155 [Sinomonas humi]